MLVRCSGKCFEGSLHDSLASDIDPRTGRHLSIHYETELLQAVELLVVGPAADQVRVGNQDARRFRMRAEDSNGFSGLNQQGLIILELAERAHNGVERWPIAGGASRSTVDDQLIGDF